MSTPAPQLDPREAAELFAAGALTDAEHAEFLSKVLGGDAAFCREFDRVSAVSEALVGGAPTAKAPDRVRAALMARVMADAAAKPKDHADDLERMMIVRAAEVDWQETGVAGVQCRKLFADPKADRQTILFRMAPGTIFPDHEHGGVEECYVLDGDLSIAGTTLRRNDYIRVPKGARHGEPRTTGGALLLITCPLLGEAA